MFEVTCESFNPGPSLRLADAGEGPRLHGCRGAVPGAWDRGQHDDLQLRERPAVSPTRCRIWRTADGIMAAEHQRVRARGVHAVILPGLRLLSRPHTGLFELARL